MSINVHANYITSAELTYTCLSDYRYRVKLVVYAECGQFDLSTQGSYDLKVSSQSTGKELTLRLFKDLSKPITGEEIVLYCPSQQAITRCKSGGTLRGIRKFEFFGDLDLSSEPRAADWLVSWQRDFRSINLNTSLNPENFSYYTEALINTRDATCNSSVQINNSSIAVGYLGQSNTFNLLANDTNGDSLVYSIVQPRTSSTTNLAYRPGYSAARPIDLQSNLSINSRTGQFTYRPLTNNQSGITDIKVSEYRGGVLVGSTTFGVQINGFSNDNKPPILLPFGGNSPGASFTRTFCSGQSIDPEDLRVITTDPDGNNLTITQVSGNGTGFNGSSGAAQAVASINPPSATGTYTYVVRAIDDGCQQPQSVTATYTLIINDNPTFNLSPRGAVPCTPPTKVLVNDLKGKAPYSYSWTQNGNFVSSESVYSTAPTNDGINIGLEVTDANGCKSQGSTSFDFNLIGLFASRRFCIKDTTILDNLSTTLLPSSLQTTWQFPDGTRLQGNQVKYKFQDTLLYNVQVTTTDEYGCSLSKNLPVKICPEKPAIIKAIDTCTNRLEVVDIQNYGHENCVPNLYIWNFSHLQSPVLGGPSVILGNLPEGELTIRVTAVTSSSCTYTDTVKYIIKKQHETTISDSFGTEISRSFSQVCNKPDTTFFTKILTNPNGGITSEWSSNTGATSSLNFFTVSGAVVSQLITTDNAGCKDTSSVTINFPLTASFDFEQKCYPDTIYTFNNTTSYLGDINKVSFTWEIRSESQFFTSNQVSTEYALPERDDFQVTLSAKDANECLASTSKVVYNRAFVDVFDVFPDQRSKAICATDVITAYSVVKGPKGSNINSISWDFGDGRPTQVYVTKDQYTGLNENLPINGDTVQFFYSSDIVAEVSYTLRYNNQCTYQSGKKTVNVS